MTARVLLSMAASLAMLAGCTTIDQIRAAPPVRSGEVAGDYRTLAACLARGGLPSNTQMVPDDARKEATVTLMIEGLGITDVRLSESAPGRSVVEVRADQGAFIGPTSRANDMWTRVERCSAQAAQAAPSQR